MAELNSLIKEKEALLDNVIIDTKKDIELKLLRKNKKINFLRLKNLRKTLFLILREKTNLRLNEKILKKIKQSFSDYSKFDMKLEDLDAMKLIISQVEVKERKIINLEKENKSINEKNAELNEYLEQHKKTISELSDFNSKLSNDVNTLKETVNKKEEELSNQVNSNKNLEKTIFELEGIKKIQYETIYNLKNEIKKRNNELTDIKNESKSLVDEFNKILEIIK